MPFHFEVVLKGFQRHIPGPNRVVAAAMASLCSRFLTDKECSGDSWESLFVLLLLVRSIAALHDDNFVPQDWFECGSVNVKYNPYKNAKRLFSKCTNWAQLKEGLIPYQNPTISIFYPRHAQFKTYDAIVVYSENNKLEYVYGYQLKEGRANSSQPVDETFTRSFVINGLPSNDSIVTGSGGWSIPSKKVIDDFFGVSGKHWTPQAWASLTTSGCGRVANSFADPHGDSHRTKT